MSCTTQKGIDLSEYGFICGVGSAWHYEHELRMGDGFWKSNRIFLERTAAFDYLVPPLGAFKDSKWGYGFYFLVLSPSCEQLIFRKTDKWSGINLPQLCLEQTFTVSMANHLDENARLDFLAALLTIT